MDDVYFGIFFEINPGVVPFPDSSLMCLVPQVSSCHLRELSPSCLWRVNLAFVLLLVALDFELDRESTKIAQNTYISRNPPKTHAYAKTGLFQVPSGGLVYELVQKHRQIGYKSEPLLPVNNKSAAIYEA